MKKLLLPAFLLVLASCGNGAESTNKSDVAEDPDLNEAQVPVNPNGNIPDTMGLPDRPMIDSSRLDDTAARN